MKYINFVFFLCLTLRQATTKDASDATLKQATDDALSFIAKLVGDDLQESEDIGSIGSLEVETAQINGSETHALLDNGTVSGVNKTKFYPVTCKERTVEEFPAVKLVNSSVLASTIIPSSNKTANECVLILFYAPWCHFCAAAAPHYNALARLYPSVHVLAINAIKYHSLNTRYGTVAVPNVLLFHNGRAITKYNETFYTLDKFSKFVIKYTGLTPVGAVNVTSADFEGPLPSEPAQETDYLLWTSWLFIVFCCVLAFAKSPLCHYIKESVRNNWLEAEAQHEHEE